MLVNVVYKGSPATDAEFTYNAFNQKVLESVSSAPEDLVLAWDGGQYLGSTPVGTDLKTARLNVDGVAIAELVDGEGRVDYLVDALGSVTGVTNASGSVKRDARYSPYGTLLSGNQFEWGWTGNTGSRHTGVPYAEQYNWNRHYSSRTKQWISKDIDWIWWGAYNYAVSNPVSMRDWDGKMPSWFRPILALSQRPMPPRPTPPPGEKIRYWDPSPIIIQDPIGNSGVLIGIGFGRMPKLPIKIGIGPVLIAAPPITLVPIPGLIPPRPTPPASPPLPPQHIAPPYAPPSSPGSPSQQPREKSPGYTAGPDLGGPEPSCGPNGDVFRWYYGNYCGMKNWKHGPERPAPISGVDTCCQIHDDCLDYSYANGGGYMGGTGGSCHCVLLACVTSEWLKLGCQFWPFSQQCRAASEIAIPFIGLCGVGMSPVWQIPPFNKV